MRVEQSAEKTKLARSREIEPRMGAGGRRSEAGMDRAGRFDLDMPGQCGLLRDALWHVCEMLAPNRLKIERRSAIMHGSLKGGARERIRSHTFPPA
jgi:hypothetical protein